MHQASIVAAAGVISHQHRPSPSIQTACADPPGLFFDTPYGDPGELSRRSLGSTGLLLGGDDVDYALNVIASIFREYFDERAAA